MGNTPGERAQLLLHNVSRNHNFWWNHILYLEDESVTPCIDKVGKTLQLDSLLSKPQNDGVFLNWSVIFIGKSFSMHSRHV